MRFLNSQEKVINKQKCNCPPDGEDDELLGSQNEGREASWEGMAKAKEKGEGGLGLCQGQEYGEKRKLGYI